MYIVDNGFINISHRDKEIIYILLDIYVQLKVFISIVRIPFNL